VGFPVDISAYVGATVKLLGRPAVYFGATGKAIYLTTDRGDVVKVNPDGTPAWKFSVYAGTGTTTATAPAVTTSGQVFAAINGANGLYVLKLDEATGTFVKSSPALGLPSGNVSSPAVELDGAKIYVGAQGGTTGDLVVLNGADMAVLASFASGEGVVAPPHVRGMDSYVGTLAGNLYKVNSATLATDPVFGAAAGTPGHAAIGEAVVTDAFPGAASLLYVGTDKGKVFDVNMADGAFTAAYDTTDATAVVGGLVVNRATGTLAFGTSAGKFYEVPTTAGAAQVFAGYGAFTSTPTVDRATGAFLAGSDDTNVYAFPAQ
jgi:outer membrane protein assembly factor BamB